MYAVYTFVDRMHLCRQERQTHSRAHSPTALNFIYVNRFSQLLMKAYKHFLVNDCEREIEWVGNRCCG